MSRHGFTAADGTDWIVGYDDVTRSMFGWCAGVTPVEFDVQHDAQRQWWSVEWDADVASFEVVRYVAGGSPQVQWCATVDDVAAASGGPLDDDVRRRLTAAQAQPADVGAGERLATVEDLERALAGRVALPPQLRDQLEADQLVAEAEAGFQLAAMQTTGRPAAGVSAPAAAPRPTAAARLTAGLERG